MDLTNIVKIKEISNPDKANELLEIGWVLLSTGFIRDIEPGNEYHSYSLGLPDGVPDKTTDNEKNAHPKKKKYNYGF